MNLLKLQITSSITRASMIFFLLTGLHTVNAADIQYRGFNIPDQSGLAVTVLGQINSDKLGHSLMHEHLFIDYWLPLDQPERWKKLGSTPPANDKDLDIWNERFTMRNRIKLLPYIGRTRDANTLDSIDDAIDEVAAYQKLGGQTIVDVTTIGLHRQPRKLQEVASKTGVNIVMGTGFYKSAWHPEDMGQRSIADLTLQMVLEIVEGIDNTGIRAGIIGEIPAEDLEFEPKDSDEVRVLRASAHASRLTGAAISLHSSHSGIKSMKNLHTSLDILEAEGADLSRVCLGHITDIASKDIALLESLLSRGVYLQFDALGVPWPAFISTRTMIEAIETLITLGYSRQILVSHDFFSKYQQTKYGGYGLTFVHSILIPYLRQKGISEIAIKNIIEENPKRVLTFSAPHQLQKTM